MFDSHIEAHDVIMEMIDCGNNLVAIVNSLHECPTESLNEELKEAVYTLWGLSLPFGFYYELDRDQFLDDIARLNLPFNLEPIKLWKCGGEPSWHHLAVAVCLRLSLPEFSEERKETWRHIFEWSAGLTKQDFQSLRSGCWQEFERLPVNLKGEPWVSPDCYYPDELGLLAPPPVVAPEVNLSEQAPPLPPVDDGEEIKDGPIPPNAFCWNGVVREGLPKTAWRLVAHLWERLGKFRNYNQMPVVVFSDPGGEVDQNRIAKHRTTANKFFDEHGFPFIVETEDQRYAMLKRTDVVSE